MRASVLVVLTALAACAPAAAPPPAAEAPAQTAAIAAQGWTLASAESRLSFLSVKAGEIVEAHSFGGLSGEIGPDGAARIAIPLDQVKTNIDIRDERMREHFFETARFPVANVAAQIDLAGYGDLAVGARKVTPLTLTLDLHGVQAPVEAQFFVTRLGERRVEVASVDPILVHVEDFALAAGLETLRGLANLPAITPVSPVSVNLVFDAR